MKENWKKREEKEEFSENDEEETEITEVITEKIEELKFYHGCSSLGTVHKLRHLFLDHSRPLPSPLSSCVIF